MKKKIKLIFILIFIAYSLGMLVKHQRFSFSPQDINASKVSLITIYIEDKKKYIMSDAEKDQVLKEIYKLKETNEIGTRQAWEIYGTIELATEDGSLYRIRLATRYSLKGNMLASLQRVVNQDTYYYGHYNGNELYKLIKHIVEIKNYPNRGRLPK